MLVGTGEFEPPAPCSQDNERRFFSQFIQSFQEVFVCCLQFRTAVFIRIRNQIRNQESALETPESLESLPPG